MLFSIFSVVIRRACIRRGPNRAFSNLFSPIPTQFFQEMKLEHGNRAKNISQGNVSSERNYSSWVASLANPHRYMREMYIF